MNIGLFTDTYHPQINGVVTSINLLEKELARRGHNVYIFTSTDPHADIKAEKGRVYRFSSLPFIFFKERRLAVAGLFKLARLVNRLDIDVIHTHTEFSLGLMGVFASRKYDLPIVHTYHTMYEDYLHYIGNGKFVKPSTVRKVSKFYCNKMDKTIVPSEKVQTVLENYGVNNDIKVIPTGTDFHQFKLKKQQLPEVDQLKEQLGIHEGPILLSVGRLSQEKNVETILQAMPAILNEHPAAKLVIVGDGPMKKQLTDLAHTLQIESSIVITGAVPWQEVNNYYQLGDLFISASTSETQGLTLSEAIASKTPVVAKADPSLDALVTDGESGFVYQTNEGLADAVIHALSDEVYLKRMAVTAFERSQCLSVANFGNNILDVYREVVTAKNQLYKQSSRLTGHRRWMRSLFMIGK
ncbi:glycosyltransferase family 4 protein [Salipaludibacillus agaradhaerens]|uniref:Glycosyltransferase family 4 protein n=1 Tax=Salipaludibacillus agaradhaerens TaxID=76935 RepID=A0A9Q4B606_SALAG|nr:glycosyltransferase family 4 protein [Salipaludibacillus agaradhaerens]MCR6098607.1 glycosyltransferase family 4 protein [Salipaludibacillus agaradhaerens]MCR6115614.1 glycosyltransferase family 4 protein [Salipaludibacillus agaradhaerens]